MEQQVAGTVIANDEDDVALQVFYLGGQLPEVDTAQPIVGDLEFYSGLPLTFAQVVFADGRGRLRDSMEQVKSLHQPGPVSIVVARSEDLQFECRRRIRADHDLHLLASTHTICGAIAFDRVAAPAGHGGSPLRGIGAGIGEQPAARSGLGVFELYHISPYGCLPKGLGNAECT